MKIITISVLFLASLLPSCVVAQTQTPVTAPAPSASATQSTAPSAGRGVALDGIVAVVNDDVILESDVDEERRLMEFQPLHDSSRNTREEIVDRLIDRTLILQQARLQLEDEVTEGAVNDQLNALRKQIPACKQYNCETEAGWQKYIAAQGFSLEELRARWRERMEVLQFVEERFRSGITISDDQVREYYEKTLLPQFAKQNATAPKLEAISTRIQEILLQQQVGNLLADWLKSLRAQGTVRTVQPGGGRRERAR